MLGRRRSLIKDQAVTADEARNAERERVREIVQHPLAARRPEFARWLALESDLSADEAIKALVYPH
jgi:hypothetical protein